MFDNNNNQNFNNNNSMFNNNMNTIGNDPFSSSNSLNNVNNTYNEPWNQNNSENYIAPIFNNQLNTQNNSSNLNQGYSNFIPNLYDTPPVLDEIKNLNDAPITTAPTLDVLDPMNVIPESFNTSSNDILDAYDNGKTLNNNTVEPFNNPYNGVNNDYNFLKQENMLGNTSFEQSSITNNYLNQSNINFPPNENTGLGNIEIKQSPDFNNFNVNTMASNSFDMEFENNNFGLDINNQDVSNNILNDSILNQNEEPISSLLQENETKEEVNNTNLNLLSENNTLINANINKKTSLDDNEIKYDIIQDKLLEEKQEEQTDLLTLGLDESYTEPDMLEIMDIESEEDEETENISLPSALDSANKIKELVEELKKSGIDIEIEEFDFESMYQLIIKLNK